MRQIFCDGRRTVEVLTAFPDNVGDLPHPPRPSQFLAAYKLAEPGMTAHLFLGHQFREAIKTIHERQASARAASNSSKPTPFTNFAIGTRISLSMLRSE